MKNRWNYADQVSDHAVEYGMNSLNDSEALSLATGIPINVSISVLEHLNRDLTALKNMTILELMNISGIGRLRAVRIKSIFGLASRVNSSRPYKIKISSSKQAGVMLKAYFDGHVHEQFYVMALSNNNTVLGIKQISSGGMTGTVVDIKMLFKYLLDMRAMSFICAHNHPSGNLQPSDQDKRLTTRICKAGKEMDLQCLDHLIITEEDCLSFADEGLIY